MSVVNLVDLVCECIVDVDNEQVFARLINRLREQVARLEEQRQPVKPYRSEKQEEK